MDRCAPAKPIKGAYLLERRLARADRKAAEDKIMRSVKALDSQQCRNPRCVHRSRKLPIDVCHQQHRGMGGNPSLDRTRPETLISLCRVCHGLYDAAQLEIEPLDGVRGLRGPCAWHLMNHETGTFEHIATESTIGVSTTKEKS